MRRVATCAALAVFAGLVTALGVTPSATAGISPGQTLRVSLASDQSPSSDTSGDPSVSGDGRYVAFSSRSHLDKTALDDGTSSSQIYVRDLVTNNTRLLTFDYVNDLDDQDADPAEGESTFPSISASGRFVAFQTNADLTGIGSDRFKVVMVDRDPDDDGEFDEPRGNTIERAYTLLSDTDSSDGLNAFMPSIAEDLVDDGSGNVVDVKVVFEEGLSSPGVTLATATPVPGSNPVTFTVAQQFMRPQQSGKVFDTAWAPAISANGKRVVAVAVYLPPPPPPIPILIAPAATAPATTFPASAAQAPPPEERVVAFDVSSITVPDGIVPASQVVRVDLSPAGLDIAHRGGNRPLISGDGRKIVFEMSEDVCTSPSCEFPLWRTGAFIADVDADGNGALDPTAVVDHLSRDNDGDVVRGIMPTISADGRYAAFVTDAENTHNGLDQPLGSSLCAVPRFPPVPFASSAQSQSTCQIVVRDLALDKQLAGADPPERLEGELGTPSIEGNCTVDAPPAGETCAHDGIAEMPALAGDGSVVAYTTDGEDLVAGDDNGEPDVYARRFTPTIQATPDPVDFGGVQVGDTANAGTVISAVGFGPLKITGVAVTGPGYTLDTHTCGPVLYQRDPASTCAVSVDYAPTGEGTQTGSIDVTPSFSDPVKITVSGVGTPFPQPDPAFQALPDPLDFGERLILSNSAATVVAVRNNGSRVMLIDTVSLPPLLAPSAPEDYRITATTCAGATLLAGAACTVTLVHSPRGPGARPAVLQVNQLTPVGVQPHLVQLRGAGTAPKLQVNPGVVTVGRITSVIGTGYPPGCSVAILMPGFPELVNVTVNADGTFTKLVQVYPNGVPGSRVVDATTTCGVLASAVGDNENLLVVPGSIGPPDFLVRR